MRIFMDVDGARRVVRQMREAAQQHQTRARRLQTHLQQLQQHWEGDAPRVYMERQQAHLRRIQQYVQTLLHLADTLEREIDQYLRMDILDEF